MIASERTSEEIKESDIVRITWMLDTHSIGKEQTEQFKSTSICKVSRGAVRRKGEDLADY